MFKSYFITGWRSFLRNKAVSVIKVGGLVLGLTTGIIMCLIVTYMLSTDRFQKNYNDIYMLEFNQGRSGHIETSMSAPAPFAPVLKDELPALKYVTRSTYPGQSIVRYGDKVLYQTSIYTDTDFFKIMSFPALEGNAMNSLKENSVVITKSTAIRLFGTDKPQNKTIVIDNIHPFKVGAVVQDVPDNSSVNFDLILPFKVFEHDNDWVNRWNNYGVITWMLLAKNTNLSFLNAQLNQVLRKHSDEKYVTTFAYPLSRLLLYDNFVDGRPSGGKINTVILLAVLAIFVLLIACVNFINLSTAMADRRATEVGLRKVLGASRKLLIGQFMGEAMFVSIVSLIVSIAVTLLVLPWFEEFLGAPLNKELGNMTFWIALLLLGLFTGLMAGIYPALYLSHFQPSKVLTRLFSSGLKGASFRRTLVTFQFFISISFIIAVIVIFKNIKYQTGRPMGYNISNLVDITADGNLPERFNLFKDKLKTIPGISDITAESDNLVGIGTVTKGLDWPGKTEDRDIVFHETWVQYNWTRTLGLQMEEGRDFDPAFGTDTSACLLNEAAVRAMELKQPVLGTKIGNHTIIGVTRDFVYNNPVRSTAPLIVYLKMDQLNHVLVRLNNTQNTILTLNEIEKAERSINPFYPFTFSFVEDTHQEFFNGHHKIERLVDLFATVAILLSCLGLFGLACFIAERRAKEISIRKVLGAGSGTIWFLLSGEFLKPVFTGLILAFPLAALSLSKLLSSTSDYRTNLSWDIFALAGLLTIFLALITVTYHATKAASINPAQALRTE